MRQELLNGFVPLPEDRHGWNSTSPVFKELIEETQPKVIVEVGSWKGASAIEMATRAKELGLDTTIYCVDTWLGSLEFRENREKYGETWDLMEKHGYPQVYCQFLSNVVHAGVEEMIEPLPTTAKIGARLVPSAKLIYVDAGHEYEDVIEDIEAYWLKLEDGGVMFGDDYFLTSCATNRKDRYEAGVKKAVDEFAQRMEIPVETRYNNFWILRK